MPKEYPAPSLHRLAVAPPRRMPEMRLNKAPVVPNTIFPIGMVPLGKMNKYAKLGLDGGGGFLG